MEIYSPKSRTKELFKKNQFKIDEVDDSETEIFTIRKEILKQASVIKKENPLKKVKNAFTEKVRIFFQVDESIG
jgi:hypothetical protein